MKTPKVKNNTLCAYCNKYDKCPKTRMYSHLLSQADKIASKSTNLNAKIDIKCCDFDKCNGH